MKNKDKKESAMTRRGLLPLLASGLFVPFLGLGKAVKNEKITGVDDKEEYQTLLKPDGTVVRVKKKTVLESKIIEKDLSNKSLLTWLDKK